ncbi:MAG TPA: HAD family hydrolase [Dehalococcoidia bacterium]|nr:HAD family hydrolase [Dehalococcoidia bacterium]
MQSRERRLYLFDIDGTLLSTGGSGRTAMAMAFERVFGVKNGFEKVEFTGRSDLAIAHDALRLAALSNGDLASVLSRFKRAYYRQLPALLAASTGHLLPGVVDLLKRLNAEEKTTVSLGTGNFRASARIKLRHYGIHEHFRYGGFGDRTTVRAGIIEQGIRAANRAVGKHGTVFVIGDTVHDIAAAKANGAVAVGVATGLPSRDELAGAGPDILLDTMEDAMKAFSLR